MARPRPSEPLLVSVLFGGVGGLDGCYEHDLTADVIVAMHLSISASE